MKKDDDLYDGLSFTQWTAVAFWVVVAAVLAYLAYRYFS